MKIFRFLGVISAILLVTGLIWLSIGYSFSTFPDFALSDFGRSPGRAFSFNALMIVCGYLNLGFALYLRERFKLNWQQIGLLIFASLAVIGVGLFPLPVDNNLRGKAIHWVFGLGLFVAYPTGVIVFGRNLTRGYKKLAKFSIYAGIVTIVFGLSIWLGTESIMLAEIWEIGCIVVWVGYVTSYRKKT